jgi:ankyrin repeat protein
MFSLVRRLCSVSAFAVREASSFGFCATGDLKLYFLKILSAFLGVNPHFTQWFFKSGDVNGALLWASELGQVRLVNLLIKGGANLEYRNRGGVYFYDCWINSIRGYDWTDSFWIGFTPLIRAVKNKHYDVVKVLSVSKAHIGFRPLTKQTALTHAIGSNDTRMVGILIRAKANIHKKDNLRRHYLFSACEMQSVDIVRILLISKADPNQNKRRTPLKFVCDQRNADIRMLNLLLEFKANIEPGVIGGAVLRGNSYIVSSLINAAADVNIIDKGWTPLHYVCRMGSLEKVRFLLDVKADPNISVTFNREKKDIFNPPGSAIGNAVLFKHYDIVEELLRRGADYRLIFDNVTSSQAWGDQRLSEILKNFGIDRR